MYFIAVVAPPEIELQVQKWKNYFKEKYQCFVALKSPAHITLIPPFWMNPALEKELIQSLDEFCAGQNDFTIHLNNFSSFPPRVIFINIDKNESLEKFHDHLNRHIIEQNHFPVKKDNREFHPHVTLTNRDLYKKAYYEAWEIFSEKQYDASWIINSISLLRHNKKNWEVIFTSQFED